MNRSRKVCFLLASRQELTNLVYGGSRFSPIYVGQVECRVCSLYFSGVFQYSPIELISFGYLCHKAVRVV